MVGKKNKLKISVIMAIYNVEDYLEEAIESIINQTIGFEKNIQLVLVNDGSPDNSSEICLKYKDKYPNNIKYIEQENKGVSSARNKGIENADGEIINFCDPDDILDLDVCEKVYNFFKEHKDEIDIVSLRQKFFEAREGYHTLDYKFTSDRVIDLKKEYNAIQLSSASSFIKKDLLDKYKFNESLEYSEDATLIGEILMKKMKYGVISSSNYNYRKRANNTSALQTKDNKRSWYINTTRDSYMYLFNKSISKFGKVLPYFQYQVMYELQWRVKEDLSKKLNKSDKKLYIKYIHDLLQYIDDKIIFEQKKLWGEYKILTLCIKYDEDVTKRFEYIDDCIMFNDIKVFKMKKKVLLKLDNIIEKKNKNIIEGSFVCCFYDKDWKLFVESNDETLTRIKRIKTKVKEESIIGDLKVQKKFKVCVPKSDDYKFYLEFKGKKIELIISRELQTP